MTAQERYDEWIENMRDDNLLRLELLSIKGDEKEIEERFSTELHFGTAGLRGKLKAGTNCMNRLTIGRATQGFSNYLLKNKRAGEELSVAIAFDPRHKSKEFAELSAEIFAANGIRVYSFDSIRPTPELAFLIRYLKTTAGLNITASHNPRDYNGYKVYYSDGCQISGEVSDGIAAEIQKVSYFGSEVVSITHLENPTESDIVLRLPPKIAEEQGLFTLLGEKEDRAYLDRIEAMALHDGGALDKNIPIVYTPLNGAGSIPFRTMMADRGFTNFHIVEEQKDPDPDFTTVGYPNPEDPKAFKLSEMLGAKVGADVLLATDPDSDRFAIELKKSAPAVSDENGIFSEDGMYLTPTVKDETPEYIPLNGNQTGYLLLDYILSAEDNKRADDTASSTEHAALNSTSKLNAENIKKNVQLNANTNDAEIDENKIPAVVRSIVTSPLSNRIAAAHGAVLIESLTGFKNICGTIPWLNANGFEYRFGWEESVGYAPCPDIRDKDGICAGMLVAEMAAYYKKQGKTLYDVLMEIYARYGYFAEDEPFIIREGLEGKKEISDMMANLRKNPFKNVAGYDVVSVTDYSDGVQQEIKLPASCTAEIPVALTKASEADDRTLTGPAIPPSNVLKYVLSNGTTFFVRPSGTEPKIKFYFYSEGRSLEEAKTINEDVKAKVIKKIIGT